MIPPKEVNLVLPPVGCPVRHQITTETSISGMKNPQQYFSELEQEEPSHV